MSLRLAALSSLLLAACGGASQPASQPPTTDTAPPCSHEIARQCPDGQVDACLLTPTAADTHVCVPMPALPSAEVTEPPNSNPQTSAVTRPPPVAQTRVPASKNIACKARIRQICADGFVDGCNLGVTTVHACVAVGSKSGPACPTGVLPACPDGQATACAFGPPIANDHVCVVPDNWK